MIEFPKGLHKADTATKTYADNKQAGWYIQSYFHFVETLKNAVGADLEN